MRHTTLAVVIGVLLTTALVAVGLLPVAVVVLSLPFVAVAARRPVLRRLALRNASRRPKETALVLLGALLGTAIITGSAIVGDTLEASIRRGAFTKLGPVDMVVRSTGLAQGAEVAKRIDPISDERIDGKLPAVGIEAAVATRATVGDRRAEPTTSVYELDFDRARAFGGDPEATGIEGPTPGAGEVVIGEDLADTLDAGVGDELELFAYGASRSLRVSRVLPRLGIAGLRFGFGSESPTAFVAPGTIAALSQAAPTNAAPPTSLYLVSNRGDVIDGAELAPAVERLLETAIDGLPASVTSTKADLLQAADENGEQFTQLFTSIGFFSVLAGILLLVNIFVMLAQERKTEMGMLRAVGLRRAGLIGSSSIEGWLYALGSAALGTVAGLGVGRLIVFVAAGIFADEGTFSLELEYTATLASIHRGFITGFVMSLLTVLGTSIWISRLNVIRAIRDLPEPTSSRQRVITLVLGAIAIVLGGVLTTGGLQAEDPFRILVGPALLGLGVVPLAGRFVPRRPLVTVVSALVLFWGVASFDIAGDAFRNPDISLFVVSGVMLTAAAVALASQNQDTLGRVLRRLGGGSKNMSLRLGLAYPLARRFRTGMILTMYALVVFTLTSITLFSRVFSNQIDDFTADVSGGFDVQVVSNPANPLPMDRLRAEPGVGDVAPIAVLPMEFDTPDSDGFQFWPTLGFDETYVQGGPPALEKIPEQYADDAEAYRAVLANPRLVIVDEFFLQQGGGPPQGTPEIGDTFTMRDPASGRTLELEIGAISEAGFNQSYAIIGKAALRQIAGERVVDNLAYVEVTEGDPQAFAERLNGEYLVHGADAVSFRKAVADGLASQQQFFRLMQGYLALGLVVGIAGLGVVMARAVRERRRQVGVLRALGFEPVMVRRAFMAESSFVALQGIGIGTVLAVVSTWRLISTGAFGNGLAFSVPWLQLVLLVVLTFGASLLATLAPAQQASRIRPAVALRIAD